jgi:hypothetical protein
MVKFGREDDQMTAWKVLITPVMRFPFQRLFRAC